MAGVAPVADDPFRHAWQMLQERHGVGQLMGLAGRNPKGDRVTCASGNQASLGSVAATRAAIGLCPIPRRDVGKADRCFTIATLGLSYPQRAAPTTIR